MSGLRDDENLNPPFSLTQKISPWVVFAPCGDSLLEKQVRELQERGGIVRHLNAEKMRNPASLFHEFAQSLGFPGYFGHNWDALVDCLDDLHSDWHGNANVAIVINNADLILKADHLSLLVSVLCQAAERANSSVDLDGDPLDRPAIALHFIFLTQNGAHEELAESLARGDWKVEYMKGYLLIG
jgi:RNAse (barnase) inhibitor barstar